MLTTGNQLKAARALVGMDQGTLAQRAGVNINTISSMEKTGTAVLSSGLDKVKAVMAVLEREGIEFLNHGLPGVRLRPAWRVMVQDMTEKSAGEFPVPAETGQVFANRNEAVAWIVRQANKLGALDYEEEQDAWCGRDKAGAKKLRWFIK